MTDARSLRIEYEAGEGPLQPYLNAESYAAAATELWAEKFCNRTFIPPKDGL